MMSMSEFLIMCKPRSQKQHDYVNSLGLKSNYEKANVYLQLDKEEKLMSITEDAFKTVNQVNEKECGHLFQAFQRRMDSDMRCEICGKVISHNEYHMLHYSSPIVKPVDTTKTTGIDYTSVSKTTGWICPVCGSGNSPSNQTCPCKPSMLRNAIS